MGMLDSLSTEISRVYEKLGGNEAVEVTKAGQDLERLRSWEDFEPFAFPFGVLFGGGGALLAITYRWMQRLPTTAAEQAWLIEDADPVSPPPAPFLEVEKAKEDGTEKEEKKGEKKEDTPTVISSTADLTQEKDLIKHYKFGQRWGHRLLGIPGIVVGLLLALVSGGAVTLVLRFPWQTLRSFAVFFPATINIARDKPNELLFEADKRHWFLKLIGVPGAILGVLVASPFAFAIGLVRALYHGLEFPKQTGKSLIWMVRFILKTVSPKDSMFDRELNPEPLLIKRFLLGGLGILAGALVGAVVASPIVAVRFVSNSLRAFGHVSKILINAAFERHVFESKKDDKRGPFKFNNIRHYGTNLWFGFLGGVLAFATVGFIAFGIRAARIVTPILAGLLFAPLSFFRRLGDEGIKLGKNTQRLTLLSQSNAVSPDEVHRIRKILGSRNPWTGKVNRELLEVGSISKTESGRIFWYDIAKFLRKIVTFNSKNLTDAFFSEAISKISESDDQGIKRLEKLIRRKQAMRDELEQSSGAGAGAAEAEEKVEGGDGARKGPLAFSSAVESSSKKGKIPEVSAQIKELEHPSTSMARRAWSLRSLKKELKNYEASRDGLDDELALLRQELAIRQDKKGPARTNALIDITARQMKRKYKDKSTIIMSPVEKDYNDSALDNLSAFLQDELYAARGEKTSVISRPLSVLSKEGGASAPAASAEAWAAAPPLPIYPTIDWFNASPEELAKLPPAYEPPTHKV